MIEKDRPTILVYRRTHTGDPCKNGVFGCHNCMKSVRAWEYDAVIGIGGIKPDTGFKGISRKVNWIGIGPTREPENSNEPLVTFSKFILWDQKGPLLSECACKLNKYMFEEGRIPRTGKSFPDEEIYKEILGLLELADKAPPSQEYLECTECLEYLKCFKTSSTCKPKQISSNHSRNCC